MEIVKLTKRYLPLVICLLFVNTLFAQSNKKGAVKDYTQFEDYFEKQKSHIQQVYDELSDKQLLVVKDLIIFEDEIIGELQLNTRQDSSIAVWKDLQAAFEKTNHMNIEHWLFIKMANSFDIPFADLRIRIYNKTKNGEIPNVDGRILFDEEEGMIKAKGFDYRTQVKGEIEIEESEISSKLHFVDLSWEDVQSLQDIRDNMYAVILDGARAHFKDKLQDSDDFSVETKKHILNFKVMNIQDEIVKKGSRLFAKYTTPFERICFTINISLNQNDKTVFCTVDIDGKYCSAVPFLKATNDDGFVDMYPNYRAQLDNYIEDTFEPVLKKWLMNY